MKQVQQRSPDLWQIVEFHPATQPPPETSVLLNQMVLAKLFSAYVIDTILPIVISSCKTNQIDILPHLDPCELVDTSRMMRNGYHFPGNIFKLILLHANPNSLTKLPLVVFHIVWDNGFTSHRLQAIILYNDGIVYWRKSWSLVTKELIDFDCYLWSQKLEDQAVFNFMFAASRSD